MKLFIDQSAEKFLAEYGETAQFLLDWYQATRSRTLTEPGTIIVTTPDRAKRYEHSAVYTGYNGYGREFWLLYTEDEDLKIDVI